MLPVLYYRDSRFKALRRWLIVSVHFSEKVAKIGVSALNLATFPAVGL